MILFCDTSVLLAACGSSSGASRYVFEQATLYGWRLVSCPWCVLEAVKNAPKLPGSAMVVWRDEIEPALDIVSDALTLDKLLVFPKSKDRPVLLAALAAEADVLLTLDRADFQNAIGDVIYGMDIRTPGGFLMDQRRAGEIG